MNRAIIISLLILTFLCPLIALASISLIVNLLILPKLHEQGQIFCLAITTLFLAIALCST